MKVRTSYQSYIRVLGENSLKKTKTLGELKDTVIHQQRPRLYTFKLKDFLKFLDSCYSELEIVIFNVKGLHV